MIFLQCIIHIQRNINFNQFKISNDKGNNRFNSPIDNLQEKAKEKCKLNNILYEISRIQFILQQHFDVALIQSHQMGGKLDSNQILLISIKESNKLSVQPVESIELDPQREKQTLQNYQQNNVENLD
ncbi:unnamed protein product [Paramecium octaurelia]|uniref:Uncharacterized protein n=1 Tax=Paramecium octaurelia TaxID=43137 RepID=A0A8S1YPD6_PAROT|nr:unnamed protein product [Paramecium octaurelia]